MIGSTVVVHFEAVWDVPEERLFQTRFFLYASCYGPMLEQKEKIQLHKGVEAKLDGMIDGSIGLMHQTTKADNATDYQSS